MSRKMQNQFGLLVTSSICVHFTLIFVVIISQCPISPVKAEFGEGVEVEVEYAEQEDYFLPVTSVINVCDKSVLAGAQSTTTNQRVVYGNTAEADSEKTHYWQVPNYWVSTNETINFALKVDELPCASHNQTLEPLEESERKNKTAALHFYPNGYFRQGKDIYAPDEYCIERLSQSSSFEFLSVELKLCRPSCGVGRKRPCIKKCCTLDKLLSISNYKLACIIPPEGSTPYLPTFYDDLYTKSELYSRFSANTRLHPSTTAATAVGALMPHFISNPPKYFAKRCTDQKYIPLPYSKMIADNIAEQIGAEFASAFFHLRTDGAVMYKSLKNKCDTMGVDVDTFCIDGFVVDSESPFNNTEEEYIILHCPLEEKNGNLDRYLSFTFGVLLLTTSIFPLVTSVVYTLLWKKQNVHGWTIAATSGSLFFLYIFQGMAHLIGVTLKEKALNTFYCKLLGVVVHFFFMSTFTWCSVMTFDLFITFRSVVPMNQRLQGVSRYMKYSAFGWGVPTITVVIGMLMDFVIYTSSDCSYHAVPGYGQQACWIVESSLGEYLYYPAAFLLCVNTMLFTATCVKLCMYGRGTTVRARKNNDAFGECFSRFSKLFCVMGISWTFEIVSWYIDGLGFVWYWNIFDVFNILRAVAMFVIYVCKNDILKQLDDSYPTLQRMCRPFGRLFTRKCSDEMNMESTVLSGVPNSPAIAMRGISALRASNRSSKGKKERTSCEL